MIFLCLWLQSVPYYFQYDFAEVKVMLKVTLRLTYLTIKTGGVDCRIMLKEVTELDRVQA